MSPVETRHYSEAYDERYRTVHALGLSWTRDVPTPIVGEVLARYAVPQDAPMLELGCGEGRDARPLLAQGRRLTATDLSPEAVAWCRAKDPPHADQYRTLDCLREPCGERFAFLYAVALLHMLVEDADRQRFLRFVRDHLEPEGLALLCTMGDGTRELQSDPAEAFSLRMREHPSGPVRVAATTCRVVSFQTLERELEQAGLRLLERGLTAAPPEFDSLLYAVVQPK